MRSQRYQPTRGLWGIELRPLLFNECLRLSTGFSYLLVEP